MIIIDEQFTNVMLDLETLSTKSNAVITQIGACVFNKPLEYPQLDKQPGQTFHKHVSIDSCLYKGFVIDESTIRWWMKQADDARAGFEESTISIKGALIDFQAWCHMTVQEFDKPIALWGNGAAFDNSILATAYARCGYRQPWEFFNDRCYRTVKNQFPEIQKHVPEIAHNALSDAQAQAAHLIEIDSFVTNLVGSFTSEA